MNNKYLKKYPTLGVCGLDCGLCPRYYTAGSSKCPGCCGPNFFNKHPSCSFVTCCVKKKNLEVCAQCVEFLCPKIKSELKSGLKHDSFISHRKASANMELIRNNGLEKFIEQQKKRIQLLKIMLENYDTGRLKSFYCIATTLLPINDIEKSINILEEKIKTGKINMNDIKNKSKILKELLNNYANKNKIKLNLKK